VATKKPDEFDQIDWGEVRTDGRRSMSTNLKLLILTGLPVVMLGLYDQFLVGERETTFEGIGSDLGLSAEFESIGLDFDPSSVDILFIFTLTLFAWYVILPLYQNPRMTRYYWKQFKRNRPAVVSLVWLSIVFAGGLIGPFVISEPSTDVLVANQPPVFLQIEDIHVARCVGTAEGGVCHGSWEYPLGTDRGGRDVLATLVYGMTVTMQIAFITTTIVAVIGVGVGTLSAYAGGWTDEILMRFVDIVLSFPTLIFFLLILYIYGAGLGMFIIVFSLFGWGSTARYVRSKALSVTEEEFIKATKVSGASTYRIIRRHVVPNTASSIITQLTLLIPGYLLAEAQLAFLGIGDTAVPTWGQLLSSGRDAIDYAPWIVLVPGIALFLTILAFNFLGDALLDALNPEAQAERER
jgi:peptide/nickel transport system permease protein